MDQTYDVLYSISFADETPHKDGFSRAGGVSFRETQTLLTPERPALKHIIEWIDVRAQSIHDATTKMLSNPGTEIVHLHARFPLRSTAGGHYFHEAISDIRVDGLELERLKAWVIAAYES